MAVRPLFADEPRPQQVTPAPTPTSKVRTLAELAPTTSRVRTLAELEPVRHTPVLSPEQATKPVSVRQHPECMNRSPEFVDRVEACMEVLDITRIESVMALGAKESKQLGELVSEVSGLAAQVAVLGIPDTLAGIITCLRDLQSCSETKTGFWNRKALTLGELVDVFQKADARVTELVADLESRLQKLAGLCDTCTRKMQEHKALVESLEVCIVAGRIMQGRLRRSMFTSGTGVATQFEAQVASMVGYQHIMDMTVTQSGLTQATILSQAQSAKSVIDTMIPVWRASFSTQILKYQSRGLGLSSKLDETQMSEMASTWSQNSAFITQLQGTKINGSSSV